MIHANGSKKHKHTFHKNLRKNTAQQRQTKINPKLQITKRKKYSREKKLNVKYSR